MGTTLIGRKRKPNEIWEDTPEANVKTIAVNKNDAAHMPWEVHVFGKGGRIGNKSCEVMPHDQRLSKTRNCRKNAIAFLGGHAADNKISQTIETIKKNKRELIVLERSFQHDFEFMVRYVEPMLRQKVSDAVFDASPSEFTKLEDQVDYVLENIDKIKTSYEHLALPNTVMTEVKNVAKTLIDLSEYEQPFNMATKRYNAFMTKVMNKIEQWAAVVAVHLVKGYVFLVQQLLRGKAAWKYKLSTPEPNVRANGPKAAETSFELNYLRRFGWLLDESARLQVVSFAKMHARAVKMQSTFRSSRR